ILAISTFVQLQRWESNIVLWKHTLEACGESRVAYANLAGAFMDQGRSQRDARHSRQAMQNFKEAEMYYRKAWELDPTNPVTAHDVGVALTQQGKVEEAIEQYRESVRRNPNWARSHFNLAVALTEFGWKQTDAGKRKGLFNEAISQYEE